MPPQRGFSDEHDSHPQAIALLRQVVVRKSDEHDSRPSRGLAQIFLANRLKRMPKRYAARSVRSRTLTHTHTATDVGGRDPPQGW